MKYIRHRVNTIKSLCETDTQHGVEIDVRSRGETLIIHHDPFEEGTPLIEWLEYFNHSTLILNVKEEGLEQRLISLMRKYGIDDYFFLDQTFPFLIKWASYAGGRCAVRVSEYECITTALNVANCVDWVWIDCFSKFSISGQDAEKLKSAGLKLCAVSPELHCRSSEEIDEMAIYFQKENIDLDAVCTKLPNIWQKAMLSK